MPVEVATVHMQGLRGRTLQRSKCLPKIHMIVPAQLVYKTLELFRS